jgi:SAM-dependent methyltransferase
MDEIKEAARENVRRIAAEYAETGDATGWFEALYREAEGDNARIPWADLEPNQFLRARAEATKLRGDDRTALVVGCGLGDDARYLQDLGFKVTAFDISPTAIAWAKRLHSDTDIRFETADLLHPPAQWLGAFDFVLEVYTIQPLPLELRPRVIDSIASFVGNGGQLLVVTRGRDNEEGSEELPWPLSRQDLSRFEEDGLVQTELVEMWGEEEEPVLRFVAEYERSAA